METELYIFMARLIALIYVPVGISILSGQLDSKEMYKSMQNSTGLTLFIALFGLTFGLFIVHYHNVWVADWPVLVTLLGWVAIVECVLLLAFPKRFLSLGSKVTMNPSLWGAIALLVGVVFGYLGFVG